jgi:hypothetical protein
MAQSTLRAVCFVAACVGFSLPALAQDPAPPGGPGSPRVLQVGKGHRVALPENWSVVETGVRGQFQLRNVGESQKRSSAAIDAATILVTVENRLTHEDAVGRLTEIAAERKSPTRFLVINGWPALQRRHLGPMAWRGAQRPADGVPDAWRLTTAIAIADQVVRFEGFALPNSAQRVLDEMESLAAALEPGTPGDAAAGAAHVERLRAKGPGGRPAAQSFTAAPGITGTAAVTGADAGLAVRINGGAGVDSEIEIAVSADGRNIVLGNNGRDFMVSNDGGQTFTQAVIAPGFPANGDPSLAWGRSGNFYFAFIGFPDGTAAANNVQGCSTTMTRSTNNGQTFAFVNHAALCPFTGAGMCFPDQEHIAADRWNAALGGDQVYNVWRNFTPSGTPPANCGGIGGGFVAAQLTCSQDSGQNWTGPVGAGNGDFPRVTAGRDGFVYVVSWNGSNLEINKFSSCAAGLAQQAGWPRVVATVNGFDCNLPGHDRCDQNPASNTVSVDELNPNNVFVSYTDTTQLGVNENIFVHASTDAGLNWSAGALANAPVPGRRYMPWLCTIGGEAHVTWYDRRNATPAQNDATEFWGGTVALDAGGNLFSRGDFRISSVADNACASGWPCGTRSVASAETCSVQPQLAGNCSIGGAACDFSDGCPAGQGVCQTGNGCPKYGDYNGAACSAGRLYAAWASATSPPAVTPASTSIDVFFSAKVMCCVPQIQVPGALTFPETCGSSTSTATLNVCNTGKENLEVDSITSSNPRFAVTTPSSGYPVVISPDFCFPFQATFTPTTPGPQSATFTIVSNDTVNPSVQVAASATGGQPLLSLTGSGEFGAICSGAAAERVINVCNTGTCPLNVTSVAPSCSDFSVVNNPFPATVGAGECVPVTVRYEPDSLGNHSCNLVVTTSAGTQNLPLSASTPAPLLSVGPDLAFPATVTQSVGACQSALPVLITNTGMCPATVNAITIGGPEAANYSLAGAPATPITIAPGEQVGEGALKAVFRPDAVDRDRVATLSVNWLTDPIANTSVNVTRNMCGEGTLTGVRVLARSGGVAIPMLERLQIQRLTANRNKKIVDTVANVRNLPLRTWTPQAGTSCLPFTYHWEVGTVENPTMLAPGSYVVTVTAVIGGKRRTQTVAFDVNTCGFNPTVIVEF